MAATPVESAKKKLTYKEQREFETIEDRINEFELKIDQITNDMNEAGDDFGKLADLQKELDENNQKLEETMDRWADLSERA